MTRIRENEITVTTEKVENLVGKRNAKRPKKNHNLRIIRRRLGIKRSIGKEKKEKYIRRKKLKNKRNQKKKSTIQARQEQERATV